MLGVSACAASRQSGSVTEFRLNYLNSVAEWNRVELDIDIHSLQKMIPASTNLRPQNILDAKNQI